MRRLQSLVVYDTSRTGSRKKLFCQGQRRRCTLPAISLPIYQLSPHIQLDLRQVFDVTSRQVSLHAARCLVFTDASGLRSIVSLLPHHRLLQSTIWMIKALLSMKQSTTFFCVRILVALFLFLSYFQVLTSSRSPDWKRHSLIHLTPAGASSCGT